MSGVAFAFAAGALAAVFAISPSFAAPSINSFGLPVAPQAGNASIHQWGGIDDSFAVNPDGDEAPAHANSKPAALAQNQDDADDSDSGDPGPAGDEVLAI